MSYYMFPKNSECKVTIIIRIANLFLRKMLNL